MPCFEDIVDTPDVGDPGDDPAPPTSQLFIDDASVTDKVSGGQSLKFEVGVFPINFTLPINVNYATANGSATAGTHYQSTSGTLTIPAGDSLGIIEVNTIGDFSNVSPKNFFVNLTVPINAILDDTQGKGTISYETVTTDPLKKRQFQSIGSGNRKVLDQYALCATRNQCSAFAMASWMSINEVIHAGVKRPFGAQELFGDSGGDDCSSAQCAAHNCNSWYSSRIFTETHDNGIRRLTSDGASTSTFRKIRNVQEITSFSSIRSGTSSENKAAYIAAIKRAIYKYGAVYIDSCWYTQWNSAGVTSSSPWMRPQSGWPDPTIGHSYVAFGWDDDYSHGGSLRVQNSFGGRWGSGGWGYLPYSIVKDSWTGSAWKRRDNGTSGNPWFRFFSMEYRG